MKRALVAAVCGAAVSVAARRVARFRPPEVPPEPADLDGLDADAAAARLAELVRIPTVSSRDPGELDAAAFARFRERLADMYPGTHRTLDREVLGDGALLYRWRSGADRPPMVLMAHYDVVPVEGQEWSRDPFSGLIEDGVVHGRGAIDDKGALVAIIEAVESLVVAGSPPPGTSTSRSATTRRWPASGLSSPSRPWPRGASGPGRSSTRAAPW